VALYDHIKSPAFCSVFYFMLYTTWLNTAITLAHRAATVILPYYHGTFTIETKYNDPRNLVTEADRAAERAMVEILNDLHPDHDILGEEGTGSGLHPDLPTWVLDPIDGTNNFSHRMPLFAVSIGVYHQGRVRVGVIYAPLMGWLFTAVEGEGAKLNGQPLQVSSRSTLITALAACEWTRDLTLRKAATESVGNFLQDVLAFRTLGSATLSLASVAAGWLDIYFNYHLEPWDIAAGELLIREAGGMVTHLDGAPLDYSQRTILATNGILHPIALPLVVLPHHNG
jgi:myo-inositol-1(or 4)-monophosphatase